MTLKIPDFEQCRVLVIGDVMLDRYWIGSTSRISPEAPVPIVKVNEIENKLGGAANVALNLAMLGCQTSLFGIIGNDSAGETIRKLLDASNIKHDLHTDPLNPTITKLRVMSHHQQLIRLDFEEPLQKIDKHILMAEIETNIHDYDVVVLSDYAKGTISEPEDIIALCKEHDIPVLVDPKGNNFTRYAGATALTPNSKELELIVGNQSCLEDLFTEAEILRAQLGINGLIVTLGEQGMALMQEGHTPEQVATQARDVFDVTGAGDTVIATLAASIACKQSLSDAMKLANITAGIVVGKSGTATVSKQELEDAYYGSRKSLISRQTEITTLEKLKNLVKTARANGEKIVFTNGCFDILHAGHVRYLQQAAALGNKLIVAVNSDQSVEKLKGAGRPINNLQSRMEVLASLACVAWVISFDEETPIDLINELLPDILVKGGDYKAESIVGYNTVVQHGGKVIVMAFLANHSTSAIIEKIRN